jgi:hypothetical protein
MTQADVALEVLCRFEDKPGPGRTRALIAALGAAQFSSIPSYDPPKSAPLSQSDRRLLLEAIAIAIKRNPPEYWCRFFTQWSEKLQTQAAISES